MKKKLIFGIIIAGIVAIGLWIYINGQNTKKVTAFEVATGTYEETISAIGYVEYDKEQNIQTQIIGTIDALPVEEGDFVDQGETIIALDQSDILQTIDDLEEQIALAEARYEDYIATYNVSYSSAKKQRAVKLIEIEGINLKLSQLKDEYEKKEALLSDGVIAKSEFDTIKDQIDTTQINKELAEASLTSIGNPVYAVNELEMAITIAKSNLEQKKSDLEKYTIQSPMDAIILESNIMVGDYVQPGSVLLKIGSKNKKVIWVDLDERYIGDIQLGQMAKLTTESYQGKAYEGEIVEFSPSIDTNTGTIAIKIALDKDSDDLVKGMSVKVDVTTIQYDEVILIPGEYVFDNDGLAVMLLSDDGMVYTQSITIADKNKNFVYVQEGLSVGQKIIDPALVDDGEKVQLADIEERVDE